MMKERMMDEMGLAQQAAAGGDGIEQQMLTVEEIAALLAQGIKAEELRAVGVPQRLIDEAMAMLKQMQGVPEQPTMGGMEAGLAGAAAAGRM